MTARFSLIPGKTRGHRPRLQTHAVLNDYFLGAVGGAVAGAVGLGAAGVCVAGRAAPAAGAACFGASETAGGAASMRLTSSPVTSYLGFQNAMLLCGFEMSTTKV